MVLLSSKTDYTKLPISLTQMSPAAYRRLYEAWMDFFRKKYDDIRSPVASFNMHNSDPVIPAYFRIDSTFEENMNGRDRRDAYRSLMYKIFCYPSTDAIDVMMFDKWVNKYARFLDHSHLDDSSEHAKIVNMADAASYRENKIHYFKAAFSDRTGKGDRASMDFTEIDGEIVGYAIRLPKEFAHFFDIPISGNWTHAYGLWVPEKWN